MATVQIKVDIDSTGAVRGVQQVGGASDRLQDSMEKAESTGSRLGRTLEVAFGVAIQRLAEALIRKVGQLAREFNQLSQEIQDTDNEFRAVFRNMSDEADAFVDRFRNMTGFTTTEARKIASEVAGIALSLGETEETALQVTEASAYLALQWERIAGQDFAEGHRMITRALVGQVMELQRAGIISRDLTATQFQQLSMQERLDMVTQGLTRRYGDLDNATDGLTQKNRQLRGALNEVRDTIIREVTPQFEKILTNITAWLNNNRELLVILAVMAGQALVRLSNALATVSDRTDDATSSSDRLSGALGRLIEWKWALDRAMLGLGMGIVHLEIRWAKLMQTLGRLTGTHEEWAKKIREQEDLLLILGRRANEMLIEQQKLRDNIAKEKEEREKLNEELLKYDINTEKVKRNVGDLTQVTQHLIDSLVELNDEFDTPELEVMIDNLLSARDVILRFGDDGRVSIQEMTQAIDRLNEEILVTTDPERRQRLVELREELQNIRNEAEQTGDGFADMSIFLQTTLSNALTGALTAFTDVFEAIGRGSEDVATATLKSLMAIIRGIGQQLIAWGTAQLIMSVGGDPRGWAAIAYGTALAGGSALATGFMSKSKSGKSQSGSSGVTGTESVRGGTSRVGRESSGIPESITVNIDGKLEGEDIWLSGRRVVSTKNRIGEL